MLNVSAVQPITSVSVIDALGNAVMSQKVTNKLATAIDLSSVASGVYFVTINAEKRI